MEGVVKSRSPGKLQTRKELRDLPGGPVVKTLPFNAGSVGSISGQGVKIPHALGSKKPNIKQKQFVTNSIKTLKMVHIKKKKKLLKKKEESRTEATLLLEAMSSHHPKSSPSSSQRFSQAVLIQTRPVPPSCPTISLPPHHPLALL